MSYTHYIISTVNTSAYRSAEGSISREFIQKYYSVIIGPGRLISNVRNTPNMLIYTNTTSLLKENIKKQFIGNVPGIYK